MTAGTHVSGFRPDIQGLRAIAVGVVLVFHIWPQWLPGGYVGVDAFFVISGYLITSLLARELEARNDISMRGFYGRRVRRLLPAASLVLVFTAVATLLVAPRFKWMEVAQDIVASALYAQNWRLMANSVDYLAAEEAVGPLQHFWSLAIEEQFYIVWPALILLVARSASRNPQLRRMLLTATVALVSLASLAASVYLTSADPAIAYFASHTRVWELGVGCVLALMPWRGGAPALRALAGWLGLAMVLASAVFFTKQTPFPGYAALLPTLGTALAIWSGSGGHVAAPQRLLAVPPMQFLGDISYSLYLWHWPLIVFAGYAFGGAPGIGLGLALLAASLLFAWLSKRYVEDAFRTTHSPVPLPSGPTGGEPASAPAPRLRDGALALGVGCTAVALVSALAIGLLVKSRSESWENYAANADYPGALVLTAGATAPAGKDFIPSLESARSDLADAYGNGCHARPQDDVAKGCSIGAETGERTAVLIGDSHAANWIPAFEELGKATGWRVISYTKSACPLTLLDHSIRGKPYTECTTWSRDVIEQLRKSPPDMIVLGRSRNSRIFGSKGKADSDQRSTRMLEELVTELRGISPRVVLLQDTPRMPFDPPQCLAGDQPCSVPRAEAVAGFDPLVAAAAANPKAELIDMTDAICSPERCDSVVGNVLVWRDPHHLTAVYSRTLAPVLAQRLGLEPAAAQ
ncbi:acyltransferase family protein [Arenimonas terrae]|nr:acyltransferase family protein [Arenimonas terrae]